jgi:hypothetical protein
VIHHFTNVSRLWIELTRIGVCDAGTPAPRLLRHLTLFLGGRDGVSTNAPVGLIPRYDAVKLLLVSAQRAHVDSFGVFANRFSAIQLLFVMR